MGKKKLLDKTQARERRNRLLESAASAELSLTEGVREMRAISGLTQDEFAHHRGVSSRVIKALELNQGNPTVATLNRIGQFFGLEVAFVPVKRAPAGETELASAGVSTEQRSESDKTPSSPSGPWVFWNKAEIQRALDEQQISMDRRWAKLFTELSHITRAISVNREEATPPPQDTGGSASKGRKKRKPS